MARQILPYFNATTDGQGMEGLINYTNSLTDYWMISVFLLVFYSLTIYIMSKSEWKLGGSVAWVSLVFFILGWIVQTFTQINQMVIFIFFVGIIAGIVMSFIENAKS